MLRCWVPGCQGARCRVPWCQVPWCHDVEDTLNTIASRVPPPLLFITAFLAGLLIQYGLTGRVIGPAGLRRVIGAVVVAAGLALIATGGQE